MSQNVIYTRISEVVASCSGMEAQLAMIDTILINMLTAINEATATGTFEEYKLDTGQTRAEIRYRSLAELEKAYRSMLNTQEIILARLNNRRTGRIARLIDGKNFIGNNWPFNRIW